MGHFGASLLGDLLTRHLAKHCGSEIAIYAWAGWTFLAAILAALLWNKSSDGTHAA